MGLFFYRGEKMGFIKNTAWKKGLRAFILYKMIEGEPISINEVLEYYQRFSPEGEKIIPKHSGYLVKRKLEQMFPEIKFTIVSEEGRIYYRRRR